MFHSDEMSAKPLHRGDPASAQVGFKKGEEKVCEQDTDTWVSDTSALKPVMIRMITSKKLQHTRNDQQSNVIQ